ncbi:hypothetical protein U9M48_024733 [Paspalum notatum var. saurae]|uniref:Reverse transcriptase Ty1/copia-type domain-containing protein n=1 Tax=Paspalum notatum var. saurae TaxID=547442 RepID=A0AAQ3TNQ8_PASNO
MKTAFLNGELDEEIYMDQPEGFVVSRQEDKVCRLLKSLYGLKQAPKQWHEKFDNTLTQAGFAVNEADKCMYYRYGDKAIPAILMNCDNQTAIAKVNSDKDNVRLSRHVRRRIKSVRKLRNSGAIAVQYINTAKNLEDQFTKGLSRK